MPRISEHMKTSGTNITEVGQHLADNPTCSMSFEDVQVLTYENKMRKIRILESLYIQDYNHTNILNDNINSVPFYIFNIQDGDKIKIFTLSSPCSLVLSYCPF